LLLFIITDPNWNKELISESFLYYGINLFLVSYERTSLKIVYGWFSEVSGLESERVYSYENVKGVIFSYLNFSLRCIFLFLELSRIFFVSRDGLLFLIGEDPTILI
jgi:hypothetical protein